MAVAFWQGFHVIIITVIIDNIIIIVTLNRPKLLNIYVYKCIIIVNMYLVEIAMYSV